MKKVLIIMILACIGVACEDDSVVSRIPLAAVDLTLDLNFEDRDLIGAFNTKIFTSDKRRNASDRYGYGGILVFNRGDEIFAYDLCCPVEVQSEIRVKPNQSGQAVCSKCGAVYNLNSNGSPSSGSEYFLRQYQVSQSGYNIYKVYN